MASIKPPKQWLRVRVPVFCMALALLSACGGDGGQNTVPENAVSKGTDTAAVSTPVQTRAALKNGAELNRAELARAAVAAANQGAAGKTSAKVGAKGSVKAAANPNLVTVYRFYNSKTSAHFYTASETEKAAVLATLPQFTLDGPAFYASSVSDVGLSPVHRFFNTQTGVHFYTISEDEKTMVQASLPQFLYDGVAYYASKVAGTQFVPLYRLYKTTHGFHFYTSNAGERYTVVNTLPQYQHEGVGYYVFGTLKLPHTGMTALQCSSAGFSYPLVDCSSSSAIQLNSQQDGHRAAINPMSYSEVPKVGGGSYARTECVKDDVTGLIWEGKEATGLRGAGNIYTNYDDPTQPQKYQYPGPNINPTSAEINAASNSVGYVNHVNGIALCGYTDWRLPTPDELHNIVDYGNPSPNPKINTAWFLNMSLDTNWRYFWSSAPYLGYPTNAWSVVFDRVQITGVGRDILLRVRLVRASQ